MAARLRAALVGACLAALAVAAPAHAAFPGPNGKIAFSHCLTDSKGVLGPCDIWTMNPDGTGATALTTTTPASEQEPAWSADGNMIAFTSDYRFSGSSGRDVYVMRSDGSEIKQLTHFGQACPHDPSWSPDGSAIVFWNSCPSSGPIVEVVGLNGNGPFTLAQNSSHPAWSPDGQKIAYQAGGNIWTMNPDGTSQTELTFGTIGESNDEPNWSPDGQKIAFSSDAASPGCAGHDIYTMNRDGSNVTPVTSYSGFAYAHHAAWSPDGQKIAFAVSAGCAGDQSTVYAMNANGTQQTLLAQDASSPDWQAVGPPLPPIPDQPGKIVFASNRDHLGGSGGYEIYTMNPDGTKVRGPLTRGVVDEQWPAWSPDGSRIAFVKTSGVRVDVWAMNADGGAQTNLTNSVDASADPSWSPDGTKIVFDRADAANHNSIWTMNADGTGQTQITSGPGDEAPDWSPDGTSIAFSHNGNIYTVRPDGSGLSPVTSGDSVDLFPNWSPDGQKLVFGSAAGGIWKINADGSGRTFLSGGGGARWNFDGSKILFSRQWDNPSTNNVDIFAMNPDGTGQTDLTNTPGVDTEPNAQRLVAYPRPKGASPMRISLVPAQRQCTAPNSTHGAPLSFGSCTPPQLTSSQLTTGTPDANGLPVRMNASMLLRAVPGNSATPQNEADVKIDAHVNDVFKKDLSDYSGALRASLPLRITDKNNTPAPGGFGAATTVPFQYGFDIPCTPDPAANVGSDCSISTTADTLVPGTITESLRTVWQIGRVRVDDAGPDGNPDTTADNTVFAVQGLFVP